MPSRAHNWLVLTAWVAAVVAVLLLLFPLGFPNYDTIYQLVWGRELAHGMSPDYDAALPPTPHPLAELVGLLATPLGDGAIDLTMAIAYLSLGLIGYLVYRLGSLWFDRPVGAVAAAIVLTRAPYLSNGIRAYVDLPYIALVLGALAIETRRPRAGWPVLALLALAGLLRPEAWLFSLAYLGYLLIDPERLPRLPGRGAPTPLGDEEPPATSPTPTDAQTPAPGPKGTPGAPLGRADTRGGGAAREEAVGVPLERADTPREQGMGVSPEPADTQNGGLIRPPFVGAGDTPIPCSKSTPIPRRLALIALALAAPLLWALFDWLTAGSPTHSFTGTRETVETLARKTGPVDLVLYGPRRLGEVLQWPAMVGAAGGVALGLAFLRRRSAIGVAAAALALAAFAILASAGLAIIPRYTMLAAAALAVFAALALLGWRHLERGDPWRRAWQGFAAIVAAMFVIWGPNQYDLLHRVDVDLTNQGAIEEDLGELADSGAFEPLCLPISVPNHRAVPRLAFHLDVRPSEIVSFSQQRQPARGYFLDPASPFVVRNFVLDPNDPARLASPVPPGFRRVARNESWILYRRC